MAESSENVRPVKEIKWENFPSTIVPALKGVLDELETPTIDRSPKVTEELRLAVRKNMISLSKEADDLKMSNRSLSNREIADHFKDVARDAKKDGNTDLADICRSISYMANAFERPRRSKGK